MCNTFSGVETLGELLRKDPKRPPLSKPGAIGPILAADTEANTTRSIKLPA